MGRDEWEEKMEAEASAVSGVVGRLLGSSTRPERFNRPLLDFVGWRATGPTIAGDPQIPKSDRFGRARRPRRKEERHVL